jgi:Fe-S-cluster containining protein
MNIREFSHNLQKLNEEMADTFMLYQASTGLHCLPGCGKCCQNPDVEATPMEMIPMALKILDEGSMDEWHERLSTSENLPCLIFNGKNCGSYQERPSVCRMFGVGGYFDKEHKPVLSICKHIREANPVETKEARAHNLTPMISHWSSRLAALHPDLIKERQSINRALKIALEKVALWSQLGAVEAKHNPYLDVTEC